MQQQALHSPSNFTSTNLTHSSPISTNPNSIITSPDSLAAPKSTMAQSSSLTATDSSAGKENICPLTNLAANSRVLPKRRKFVRKPLEDITNQFKQQKSSAVTDGLLWIKPDSNFSQRTLKRKAGLGDINGGIEEKMSCRSKMLRISFR